MNRLKVLSGHLLSSSDSHDASSSSSEHEGTCIVLGGCVMDIVARPHHGLELKRGTSVPGRVTQVHGGVGRNIAEGLSHLMSSGPHPVFISVLGDDAPGRSILSYLMGELRLDCKRVSCLENIRTPTVLCALDKEGDVAACVADCSSIETSLTPETVSRLLQETISSCSPIKILILEANLSEEALIAACTLAHSHHISIFLEPVSVAKSLRSLPVLGFLSYIKPNAAECRAIGSELRRRRGQVPIKDPPLELSQGRMIPLLPYAAEILAASPTSTIVLTMGDEGAALISRSGKNNNTALSMEIIQMAALPVDEIKSTNGAGDSLVASMIAALMRGKTRLEALSFGVAGANRALGFEGNVPRFALDDLVSDAKRAHDSMIRSEVMVDLDIGILPSYRSSS